MPDTEDTPPQPSSDQSEAVSRYLNRFRLLTSELYVEGPAYQAISVDRFAARSLDGGQRRQIGFHGIAHPHPGTLGTSSYGGV